MRRRTLLVRSAAALVAASAASGTTRSAHAQVDDSPRRGGALRYGVVGDFATLDGQTVSISTIDTLWTVWDRLIALDANLQPQPMLAETWDVNSDYTAIQLRLRRGVQFHTGREMTADDVRWCLQRVQDPTIGSTLTGRASAIAAVETPDTYTVLIRTLRPWTEVFDFLEYVNVVDPVTFQNEGIAHPVGTGPFVFSEYAQGDHLWLTRNTNYWRGDQPYLDAIQVAILRDAQAAAVQLETGALHLVGYGLRSSDTVRFQNDPAFQVQVDDTTGSFWAVVANCTAPPTDNKLFRQALHLALDRQRMTDMTWRGLAKSETLPWSRTSSAYDGDKAQAYPFDLETAKALLEQSGVSAARLELAWSTALDEWSTIAQIYQADLASIGIDVTLRPMDRAPYSRLLQSGTYNGLMLAAGLNGHMHPGTMVLGPFYGPQINYSGFRSDAYTQLTGEVLGETDPARQRQLSDQLNDVWLDESWVMPISQNPPHVAAVKAVRGLRYDAHEALVLPEAWLVNGV